MRKSFLVILLSCTALGAPALAEQFTVGEHVRLGTGDTGTVIAVGDQLADGGMWVQVELDRLPPSNPPSGPWYDSKVSQVTPDGGQGRALPGPHATPTPVINNRPPVTPAPAPPAQQFTVGEHVRLGTGDTGTVIAVGDRLADGGMWVQVELDRLGPSNPPSGPWYDSKVSRVTPDGGQGRVLPPAPPPPEPPPPQPVPQPAAGGVAGSCQQAIRSNYPDPNVGTTNTVNFLSFSMGGPQPYEAVYGGDDVGGRGHTVQGYPVQTKYTVLTHYQNPNSNDELRTYTVQYMCYQAFGTGEWIAGMISREPGGEEPTYIPKH